MNTDRPDNDATGSGHDPDSAGDTGGRPTAGPRRRRSPMAVASVAAAVLVAGGGGAYVAATASDGVPGRSGAGSGEGTPPPLALDGYTESAASATGGPDGTHGIAPGEPDPNGVVYRAGGDLPEGPGSAPVYRAKGEVTAAEVTRLARALGVDGTPTRSGGTWKAGTGKDGFGPTLRVTVKAPGSWTFSRYAPGTDDCKGATCGGGSGGSGRTGGSPVSEAAARKAAAPVLKAAGQDDAKIDASGLMGAVRVVNADPEVGGLPTYGWTTGVRVGADGRVVSGNGTLKAPVKGDTYPVVGAARTLELLNGTAGGGGRKGIGGCASPVPLKDRNEVPCEAPTGASASRTVTVEKAVFGLAARYTDGGRALVPSWLFQVRPDGARESFTVTHPAVDPRFLTSPAPPSGPVESPSPRPTGPGDGAGTAPTPRDVRVNGYSADGKALTVTFTGGVCADYAVAARQTSDDVTVTVTEKPWKNRNCILIAKFYHRTVQLDAPLGGRAVVGTDGGPVPEGTTAPTLPKSPQPR
ncbi:hypothetical protein ACFY93_26785 [Streptomyces sp. NPDC008313]|uniref:hypothetical protein n=1 Tax=Streptomyces sp. NPDC008313 TaxID=3364826 RepID=UPI0036E45E51